MIYQFFKRQQASSTLFNRKIFLGAIWQSIIRLNPKYTFKKPTIFLTQVACFISLFFIVLRFDNEYNRWFNIQLFFWMLFTVIFANFAEALANLQGKAQTESLRRLRDKIKAKKLIDPENSNEVEIISTSDLKLGDIIICESGDLIPIDGEVIEGIAMVDESAITGESAPVIRESGSDRKLVTSGTRIISDTIKICVTSEKGKGFLDRMINLIDSAERQKTPSELSLTVLLSSFSIIFILATMSLNIMFDSLVNTSGIQDNFKININAVLHMAILVCLMPITIGALNSVIGISAMNRLFKQNVVALNGLAVEAAGNIDLLIIDKTGTITLGNRQATEFIPQKNVDIKYFANISQLASVSDETPEGRSIVVLAKSKYGLRAEYLDNKKTKFVPFSASTRISGIDIKNDTKTNIIRKGALDAIEAHLTELGGYIPSDIKQASEKIARLGGTPLVVCENQKALGVIHLKDIIKGGIKERFAKLKKMGIKTLMVSGDNPLTSAAIAAEAGIDDFLAEATPEVKFERIKQEQKVGLMVAMTGDGTNDAPALAQADVGVAMNTGTRAAREAGNMIDLDSNPTKIIEIVEIGKQILITRGNITTFSIANDIAKYFAVFPVLFSTLYSGSQNTQIMLEKFNIMHLASFQSAILSTMIFNTLSILGLLPIALSGMIYKTSSSKSLLTKNLLIYGISGLTVPILSIKIIDWVINYLNLI